jgi:outer membrane autotransporter protein
MTDAIYAGLDVEREIRAVDAQRLGDTVLLWDGARLVALGVCHCGPGSEAGSDACYIKFGAARSGSSLRAAWEHEYKYSALPITAGFAGIPGPSATFFGPSEGHDSAIVSAGVSVHWTQTIATYVNYDGQLGRSRYDSNAVTGGVTISF